MKKILITGSNGLIGSEVALYFDNLGWDVYGLDNNMRKDFFGIQGDTRLNQKRIISITKNYTHNEIDIRNRIDVFELIKNIKPDVLVHAAAQPSHDLAAKRPFDDFDVNAVGTLNLLEACRINNPEIIFIYMSTNKVYGDAPNNLELIEEETRFDYSKNKDFEGINENFTIDQSKHSLFGASKLAADILVQEYGRYFNMRTCCLRGGCLTGPSHSGVELHGFLSYLIKVNVNKSIYKVFGYKGKQVRDNIHSHDVARFIEIFIKKPRIGEVYNLGGGRHNSCSILEAFSLIESISNIPMEYEYIDENRIGDHICYISDLTKIKNHFPEWDVTKTLDDIFYEIFSSWAGK